MTTTTIHEQADHRRGVAFARRRAMRSGARTAIAAIAAAAIALASCSTALAMGPAPFLHRSQAERSATPDVNRIPHTGGLTERQIAGKAQRHQRAINRAALSSPAPAIAAPSAVGRDALPIVLSGIALVVAVGSVGLVAASGARIRRSAQPSA